jgi:thiopurine S-methyltransferase
MQASYWLQKWERGEIAFHESDTNLLLLNHMDQLKLASGSRVLVPLCGKTRDIA